MDKLWIRYGVKFYDTDDVPHKEWVMAPDYDGCEHICEAIIEASPTYAFYAIVYPKDELPNL